MSGCQTGRVLQRAGDEGVFAVLAEISSWAASLLLRYSSFPRPY
ncbi:hypothetical protein BN1183_CB_00220 [Pantoea ananatis]|nr:hypothetical protein BN1183_CB_00220 [Pantoea ananatis]